MSQYITDLLQRQLLDRPREYSYNLGKRSRILPVLAGVPREGLGCSPFNGGFLYALPSFYR